MTDDKKPTYAGKFLDPNAIIGQAGLGLGAKVAHFGSGTGYFTIAAAAAVGKEGEVYALDVLEHKLDLVRSQARMLGLNNVFARQVNLEESQGSKLSAESVDWVLLINVLYQNDKKSRIVGEAKRILKKDGRILMVEWSTRDIPLGPEKNSRASREEVIKIIRKHGLGIAKELEVGQFHWGMILVKSL